MITPHVHQKLQYKYELFHIYFTCNGDNLVPNFTPGQVSGFKFFFSDFSVDLFQVG